MYAQYSAPQYNTRFDYSTPPISPSRPSPHAYLSPRYSAYTRSPPAPTKTHTRRATEDAKFAYSSPHNAAYYTTYISPETTSPRNADHVSGSDRIRSKTRSFRVPADVGSGGYTKQYQNPTQSQRVPTDVFGDYGREEYLSGHDHKYRYSPPPQEKRTSRRQYSTRDAEADHYARRDQIPVYTPTAEEPAHRSRARRASHATKPTYASPPKPRPTATKTPPQATDKDARRAEIPAGFSLKHWDPREEPILLLGSVFDANSLGKWIYDWTVAYHGPATPMSEVAGDLWLLLIQLANKVKRAEACRSKIRRAANLETIEDFLDSGERLWQRFSKLLKVCEQSMLKAAKKSKSKTMGKGAGCEFVDCIFGRDRELHRTEKLMTGIRLWSMRFDANCLEILQNPTA